jgi:hypothetical protein
MIALLVTMVALFSMTEAACTGTNAFCSLIQDSVACAQAGCLQVNNQPCADPPPPTSRVPCSSIASQSVCDEARCIWRNEATTAAVGAPTEANQSPTPIVTLTTTTADTATDAASPGIATYAGMIAVLAVFGAVMIIVILVILMVCLRRTRMHRQITSLEYERNVVASFS